MKIRHVYRFISWDTWTQILSFGKDLKLPKGSPKKLAEIVYKNKKKFKNILSCMVEFYIFNFYLVPINVLIKLLKNLKS